MAGHVRGARPAPWGSGGPVRAGRPYRTPGCRGRLLGGAGSAGRGSVGTVGGGGGSDGAPSLDGGARVRIHRSIESGVAIRAVGDDVAAGTLLYPPGTVVTPALLPANSMRMWDTVLKTVSRVTGNAATALS